jgi:hypothetical protein
VPLDHPSTPLMLLLLGNRLRLAFDDDADDLELR